MCWVPRAAFKNKFILVWKAVVRRLWLEFEGGFDFADGFFGVVVVES